MSRPCFCVRPRRPRPARQRGAALVVVLLVLMVVMITGIASARVAMLGEQTARSDRDAQIAFEAAEAAIVDAEDDIRNRGTPGCATLRGNTKFQNPDPSAMPPGTCLTTAADRGICALAAGATGKPTWAAVDFLAEGANAPTVRFGEFTCRSFDAGGGVKPARPPRYLIEVTRDSSDGESASSTPRFMYRITAMGFGPRLETRAVVQVEFRKEME